MIFDANPGTNVDQPHGSIFSTGYPCRSAKPRSATTILAGELVESQLQHEPGQVQGTTLASSVIGEELNPLAALRQSNTNCCNSCRSIILPGHPSRYAGAISAVEIDVRKVRHSPLHPYRRARLRCRALNAVYRPYVHEIVVIVANVPEDDFRSAA